MQSEPGHIITCKNCGNEFKGEYCNKCGQRVIDKITWNHIVTGWLSAFNVERGFAYNMRELTIRPGAAIRKYIGGVTKPFLNPLSYFLLSMAFLFLLVQLRFQLDLIDFGPHEDSKREVLVYAQIVAYGLLLVFPLFNSLTIRLAIIEKDTSLLNTIIVSIFFMGQAAFILIFVRFITTILQALLGFVILTKIAILVPIALFLILYVWFVKDYFRIGIFSAILRVIIAIPLSWLTLFMATVMVIMIVKPMQPFLTDEGASFEFGTYVAIVMDILIAL